MTSSELKANEKIAGRAIQPECDKMVKVLEKIDSILNNNGYIQHQERIHRISKTLRSIEAHKGCSVSKFYIDEEEYLDDRETLGLDYYNSNPILEDSNNDDQKCLNELEDLLGFIENELNLKRMKEIDDTAIYSSSDEEFAQKKSNSENEPFKAKDMRKTFFKIELQIRAYLKNQEKNQELKEQFKSYINDPRLVTPKKVDLPPTPTIIRSFFEDTAEISKDNKKRISLNPNLLLGNKYPNYNNLKDSEKITPKSNVDKLKFLAEKQKEWVNEGKRVSDFNEEDYDDIGEKAEETTKLNDFRFEKRNSIFRDKYMFNENYDIQEDEHEHKLDKNDIVSEKSDYENEEEYEVIEYTEEVEVDDDGNEIVKDNSDKK